MITKNTDYSIRRLRGLSTDTKPVNVPNGSEFREMDTGKDFMYSAEGTEWIEQQGSGGGGGGGMFIVTATQTPDPDDDKSIRHTLDKKYLEILNNLPAMIVEEHKSSDGDYVTYDMVIRLQDDGGAFFVETKNQAFSSETADGVLEYTTTKGH